MSVIWVTRGCQNLRFRRKQSTTRSSVVLYDLGKRGPTMKQRCFAKIALLLAVACLAVYAQSDLGTINGFVRDATGSTVPNATVVVRNEDTGVERRATTNDAGLFVVTNIPAGFYTVAVEAKGFKKYEVAHNKLDP